MIKIKVRELIGFYDHQSEESSKDANSISALADEELGLSLLCHYFRSINGQAQVVSRQCKGPGKNGNWLDGWVSNVSGGTETLYQVEIKNWSAHSVGGRPLSITATPQEVATHKINRWNNQWHQGKFRLPTVMKVFGAMTPPAHYANWPIRPLLCYWDPIHPTGGVEPYFTYPVTRQRFPQIDVFSMSTYLRSLKEEELELSEMPQAERRLKQLKTLFC